MDQPFGALGSLLPLVLTVGIVALLVSYGARKAKAEQARGVPLAGVRGWLTLYILSSAVLAPVIVVCSTYSTIAESEGQTATLASQGAWTAYKVCLWLMTVAYVAVQWWVAHGLMTRFERSSVTRAKWVILGLPFATALTVWAIGWLTYGITDATEEIRSVSHSIIPMAVWYLYFTRSKRVLNTYPYRVVTVPAVEVSAAPTHSSVSSQQ